MKASVITDKQPLSVASLSRNHQLERLWESADRLAAHHRLTIAQRYQDQFEQLDTEFANLRTSQSWLAAQDDVAAAQQVIQYAEVLTPYLLQRHFEVVLTRWCEDGLRACERLQHNPAQLLLLRSETHRLFGRWEAAMADVQSALATSQDTKSKTHVQAMIALGRLQLNQGHYCAAFDTLTRAEPLLDPQSDHEDLMIVHSELAAYDLLQGALDRAIARYLEIERSYKQTGITEPPHRTPFMLGVLYRKKGYYAQATSYLQPLLDRAEKRGDRSAAGTTAHHLAWVCLNRGHLAEARQLCGRSITRYEEISDIRGLSDSQEQLGLINLAEGKIEEAIACIERSLTIRRQIGNQHGVASSLRRLAVAHWYARHPRIALRCLWQGLVTYWRLGALNRQRVTAILWELRDWTFGRRRWTT